MTKFNRIAGAAAVFAVALMATSVPLKSANADNDNWGRHHHGWNGYSNSGGSFYFNTGPGYYYTPPPAYYYAPPPAYYYPPPAYYAPPVYGPSFGFSVRVR